MHLGLIAKKYIYIQKNGVIKWTFYEVYWKINMAWQNVIFNLLCISAIERHLFTIMPLEIIDLLMHNSHIRFTKTSQWATSVQAAASTQKFHGKDNNNRSRKENNNNSTEIFVLTQASCKREASISAEQLPTLKVFWSQYLTLLVFNFVIFVDSVEIAYRFDL